MWRIRPILAMLFLFPSLIVPLASGDDCGKCDCIHLPCPPDCKPCCGLIKGMIVSRKDDTLELRSNHNLFDIKITPETSITGDHVDAAKGQGHQATVYFRKSGTDKLAQKVEIK